MITTDSLRAFGANVDEGLKRCMGMEAFYLQMVGRAVNDMKIDELKAAVAEGDTGKAFELAHAMKGVWGNLSITPLYEPTSRLTELLRNKTPGDYAAIVDEIAAAYERLRAML